MNLGIIDHIKAILYFLMQKEPSILIFGSMTLGFLFIADLVILLGSLSVKLHQVTTVEFSQSAKLIKHLYLVENTVAVPGVDLKPARLYFQIKSGVLTEEDRQTCTHPATKTSEG